MRIGAPFPSRARSLRVVATWRRVVVFALPFCFVALTAKVVLTNSRAIPRGGRTTTTPTFVFVSSAFASPFGVCAVVAHVLIGTVVPSGALSTFVSVADALLLTDGGKCRPASTTSPVCLCPVLALSLQVLAHAVQEEGVASVGVTFLEAVVVR